MVAAGPKGGRSISSDKFFVDLLTTALLPGEILQKSASPCPKAASARAT